MTIKFKKTEDGIQLMAIFIAEMLKQGIVFQTEELGDCFRIEFTGGF